MKKYNSYFLIKRHKLYFLIQNFKELIDVITFNRDSFTLKLCHITKDDILIFDVYDYYDEYLKRYLITYSVNKDEFSAKYVRNPEAYLLNHFKPTGVYINKTIQKKIKEVMEKW